MKTSTKNQVLDYLQWSTEEYDSRVFLSYWNWCQLHGKYPSVVQQLLANRAVNRWFIMEYQKCEKNFIKVVEVLPNNTKQLESHYKACTSQLMDLYPKPLLEKIKRNRDFSNLFIDNAPVYFAN